MFKSVSYLFVTVLIFNMFNNVFALIRPNSLWDR